MNIMQTKHPLYVKPETVARFKPRYLGYVLTPDEVANAIRDGRIGYREDAKPPDRISPTWSRTNPACVHLF